MPSMKHIVVNRLLRRSHIKLNNINEKYKVNINKFIKLKLNSLHILPILVKESLIIKGNMA